ncbi:MAG: PadR family transcriptional regulator [Candidatus Bathyarchaeia archaeon]
MGKASKAEELRKRTVLHFMDILILMELQKRTMSGYDVMAFLHKKFGVGISSGTVYATLYAMERDKLIEGFWEARKRSYKISQKEKKNVDYLLRAYEPLQLFLRQVTQAKHPADHLSVKSPENSCLSASQHASILLT